MPLGVVTLTATFPAGRAGASKVTVVGVTAVGETTTSPTVTAFAPLRLVPVKTTPLTPPMGPLDGLSEAAMGPAV